MESATAGRPEAGQPDLKHDSIGFWDAVIVGISSTAPAYSIAAVIGIVVAGVGLQAPGILFLSFIPMFLIATAFYYMNRADPDCGTNFSWITRAIGPSTGWIAGFAVCTTGLIVIGSLADVAAYYIYDILGWGSALPTFEPGESWTERLPVTLLSAVIIVTVTAICVIGLELGKWASRILIGTQVAALLLFSVVALAKVFGGDGAEGSIDPSITWMWPWEVDTFDALVLGLLTGVFIYWGWESTVNLNEETSNSNSTPGLAALASTVLLLLTYLLTTYAVVSYLGAGGVTEFEDDTAILGTAAEGALGSPLDNLVILAIITSGIASAQTTILPASRTMLSMARQGAFPRSFARIHPRFQTPDVATYIVGGVALVWYMFFNLTSQNFLFDSLTALAIVIAFYYSLTGFACVIYHRRELTKSAKNFLFMGVAPFTGASILAALFVKAIWEYRKVDDSYSGQAIAGVAIPAVLGVGLILVGIVLMLVWRVMGHDDYFGRKPEVVDPDVAAGRKQGVAAVPEGSV
ncbi:MAG TPA: APC family permease [Thermoleophilaceae bacterium]|nr:APC family permease [Thermoleophilaceae bacterium]